MNEYHLREVAYVSREKIFEHDSHDQRVKIIYTTSKFLWRTGGDYSFHGTEGVSYRHLEAPEHDQKADHVALDSSGH
jgi:hypothetical protein